MSVAVTIEQRAHLAPTLGLGNWRDSWLAGVREVNTHGSHSPCLYNNMGLYCHDTTLDTQVFSGLSNLTHRFLLVGLL
jgi:hypothetical protein